MRTVEKLDGPMPSPTTGLLASVSTGPLSEWRVIRPELADRRNGDFVDVNSAKVLPGCDRSDTSRAS